MRTEQAPRLSPRMQQAVDELTGLVRTHYPEATFRVSRSPEDRRGIHLLATVDVEDTDTVMDIVVDRVVELQVEQHLPIHVIPLHTPARVAAIRAAQAQHGQTQQPVHP
jgi:hypothetical protein